MRRRAEGDRSCFRSTKARRASHYSIALGSAQEAWSPLRTAAACGYVAEPEAEIAARYRQIIGTPLYRLAHPR